jgi:hypothetical protein
MRVGWVSVVFDAQATGTTLQWWVAPTFVG